MKTTSKAIAIAAVGLTVGFSSASFAACTSAQVSGTWEVAFSDGNSCRLKLNNNGSISADKSVCYDPTRGTTVPDSGNLKVQGNCFAEGEIVIGGAVIELPVQFSNDRTTAAGRYLAPDQTKGSVVLIRVP